MSIAQMRTYISEYPKYKDSKIWKDRVKKMPAKQVFAVYNRLRNAKPKVTHSDTHQITMFEYEERMGYVDQAQ